LSKNSKLFYLPARKAPVGRSGKEGKASVSLRRLRGEVGRRFPPADWMRLPLHTGCNLPEEVSGTWHNSVSLLLKLVCDVLMTPEGGKLP
jgi:hypothetical protein